MATKDDLQRLKDAIDCRELVQSLGIEFKGTNISCLNSSHPDNNPSMAVYSTHALCFGCNCNLDAIGIVQSIKNIPFKESVDFLASKYNVHFSNFKNINLNCWKTNLFYFLLQKTKSFFGCAVKPLGFL